MKLFWLQFIILFSTAIQAQDILNPGQKRTAETQQYRDMKVQIDGMDFDYRVLKYYAPDILQSLPGSKRKQIHFLYTASYEVLNVNECPAFVLSDLDIPSIDILRNQEIPVVVEIGDACKVRIRLMPRTECQMRMGELAN